MYITESGYEILSPDLDKDGKEGLYRAIERAGRTCYKSEANMTEDSAAAFVRAMVRSGHEAMLEHAYIAVRFTLDRGLSHELVRHRMAAFAQESTRWCNYSKDKFDGQCTFILPYDEIRSEQERKMDCDVWDEAAEQECTRRTREIVNEWTDACMDAEAHYLRMLELGASPEIARAALNNSLKTELVITANAREWRHILKLRAMDDYGRPHPQMKSLMGRLLKELGTKLPELFGDLLKNEQKEETEG